MASAAIFTRPSDNVAPDATVTIQTGTDPGDDNYGPEVLVDLNPAKMAKILDVTAAWLFDFGAAQRIDLAAFIHSTIESPGTLRLQGNATDSWGAPSFNALIDVQDWLGSGTGRWPRNQWLDLTQESGYSTTGYRYWRVLVTSNPQNVWMGQVVLSPTIRRMDPDLRWDYVRAPRKRSIVNETAFGSKTIYARNTTQYMLQGEHRMDDALFVDQEEHFYDANGVALPWLLIPDGDEPDVYFVRWVEDVYATTHHFLDVRDRKFEVEELSRGLRPGT
jgi:hypothetical protein